MPRYFGFIFCAVLAAQLQSLRAEPVSPVVLAQPSVFRLIVYGDAVVDFPESVSADMELLRGAFGKASLDGTLNGLSEPEFYWMKVAKDPDLFLRPSANRATQVKADIPYATGSAFAVSEEGVFVTNAHMVAGGGPEMFRDYTFALLMLAQPMTAAEEALTKQFNGKYRDADAAPLGQAIFRLLVSHSSPAMKFKKAHVVLRYFAAEKPQPKLSTTPDVAARTVEVPVSVLAVGRPWPGKDIAILKIDPHSVAFAARDIIGTETQQFVDNFHLICLPLADSDNVLPGTRVRALGFPGVAFAPEYMAESAQNVINSQPGEIGQPVEMSDGWRAFPLTAGIDHGDSGGPVIDEQGKVVAVNVAGVTNLTPGYRFAVPINIAAAFLREANVTPKCSLTAAWEKSVQLFYDGKYIDAANDLERIARSQAGLDGSEVDHLTKVDMQNLQSAFREQVESSLPFLRPQGHNHPGVSAYVLELESKAADLR